MKRNTLSAVRNMLFLLTLTGVLFPFTGSGQKPQEGNRAPNYQDNYVKESTKHSKRLQVDPRLSPGLQKLAAKIKNSYDKKRFIRFIANGAQKDFKISQAQMERVITESLRYLGRKYAFGQLDCSSLMQKSFSAAGVSFPRTAEHQAQLGKVITDRSSLQRGDMLYFTRTYRTRWFVTHVGIYLGDNRMIHAASDIVKVTAFPRPGYWWKKHFVFATRIVKPAAAGEVSSANSSVSSSAGSSFASSTGTAVSSDDLQPPSGGDSENGPGNDNTGTDATDGSDPYEAD